MSPCHTFFVRTARRGTTEPPSFLNGCARSAGLGLSSPRNAFTRAFDNSGTREAKRVGAEGKRTGSLSPLEFHPAVEMVDPRSPWNSREDRRIVRIGDLNFSLSFERYSYFLGEKMGISFWFY